MIGKSCGNAKEVERQKSPRVGVGYLQVGLVYMLNADAVVVETRNRISPTSDEAISIILDNPTSSMLIK